MYPKQASEVMGARMAYVDVGEGDPIVFLHGNPTSSYLWRNIIPYVEGLGRCIAPDLIGMGDSSRLEPSGPDRYRLTEHRSYLDALYQELGIDSDVTFVVHDWGSALGFDWANRHRTTVKGIVYMEPIARPLAWDEWPEVARRIFQGFRSDAGEEMVLVRNLFVERILPASVLRGLDEEEMEEYRRPYAEPGESRRPTLTWPREIPLDGEPTDVTEIVADYAAWLAESSVPKLYVHVEPGFLSQPFADFCRTWPNQTEVTVKGIHFVQEDSAEEIGSAIADWYGGLG